MDKLIGLIAANFTDETFGELVQMRPVASLPYAGRYRMVDFPLSNMVNSGVGTVGLITPYMYRSLLDHVGVGKEWTLSRKVGGMFVLPGSIYGLKNVHGKFLLRDMQQNRVFFDRGGKGLTVISGCCKVFNIDYRKVAEYHEKNHNDITLIYKRGFAPEGDGELFLNLEENGRVKELGVYTEGADCCFLDSLILSTDLLRNLLDWYDAMPYMDLVEVIMENLKTLRVGSYEFTGYVGALNGIRSYMEINMDVLKPAVQKELFTADRPISTKSQDYAPSKYMPGARVKNSLIPTGCILEGTVENSVLCRGVHVKKGAVIRNSIIMQKCVIGEGAVLDHVICDKYTTFHDGIQISGTAEYPATIGKYQEI